MHHRVRSRSLLRCLAFALLLLSAAHDRALAQPGSLSGSIGGVVVGEREDRGGDPQLLIATDGERESKPIDEVRFELPPKVAKRLTADRIPEGWTLTVKKGKVTVSGPPVASDKAIAIALGLDGPSGLGAIEIGLYSAGQRVTDGVVGVPAWPKVGTDPPKDLIQLPEAAAPNDEITFQPTDPTKTPPGGEWVIDGTPAEWNGDWEKPGYGWKIGSEYGLGEEYELDVKYTDAWGETLVDGTVPGIPIVEVAEQDEPSITDCSPKVLSGGFFCVCGYFPNVESRTGITINGKPLGAPVSASSTTLKFALPDGVPYGRFEIAGLPSGGFDDGDKASGTHVGIGGEIDQERLSSGESTPLRLWILGTDEPISLKLWNESPGIRLEGGENQIVTTSGGEPNQVSRTVTAVAPGAFLVHYELNLGSCPCAEAMIVVDGELVEEPPIGPSTLERNPECKADCDELRRRAEALEKHAEYLDHLANRLEQDRDWHHEQADWLDEETVRDRAEVATRRRFAEEYRDLVRSAEESLRENERRVREFPNSGWEESVALDRKVLAERKANAEAYDRAADALEGRIRDKNDSSAELRNLIESAHENAAKAARDAQKALLEYQECLAKLPPECESETLIAEDGDDPRDAPSESDDDEPKPDYCGPDVSKAYLAALELVYTRMQAVSDDDKGPHEGAYFLKSNGWGIDQWPSPENLPTSGGESCPSGLCNWDGNDVQQYCYTFFGYCVPRHSLNDIMYGFTADLAYVPEAIQNWGGNWAEGSFNSPDPEEKKKYTADIAGYAYALWKQPEPEISRRAYKVGDELAEDWDPDDPFTADEIREKLEEGLGDFITELHSHYPWILDCEACPEEIESSGWDPDWSTSEWTLHDGSKQLWENGEIRVTEAPPKEPEADTER